MRLSIRQVTYLLDNGHIKVQDFDTIAMRNEPFPSHLMLLQKGGMISWNEIQDYEFNIDWRVDSLLTESPKDQAMLDKYNHKFLAYVREALACSKLNSYATITICWEKIELNIPDLAKLFYIKKLAKFGIKFKRIGRYEDGPEYYLFDVINPNSDTNIYHF
jgi:hypothetical protein